MEAGMAVLFEQGDGPAPARQQGRSRAAGRTAAHDDDVALSGWQGVGSSLGAGHACARWLAAGCMIHFRLNSISRLRATFIMAATQTPEQRELAELIVSALNLEGVEAVGIDPDAALFGAGLGLDSIDALELALEISKRYGVQLKADDEDNKRIFASLRALSDYVQQKRAA
jgi:acyl carrier protein